MARRNQSVARGVGQAHALFVARGRNAELWDVEGRRFIDFAGGIAVLNTGHSHPRIVEAVVVPIGPATEPVLAALIECVWALDMDEVREQLARTLPPWSQPRVLAQVHALPRLPSGKPDRLACIAHLEQSR